MNTTRSTTRRLGLCVYRALLILYPARFRDAWGADMVNALAARLDRSRGLGGRRGEIVALVSALADLLATAPLERLPRSLRPRFLDTTSPRPSKWPKGITMPTRLVTNLSLALRGLVRQPLFSSVVLLTLTVGSGGAIALFGIVDAAILRPLPYPGAARMVSLAHTSDQFGLYGWAGPFLDDLRERTRSYDALVGFTSGWPSTLTDPGEPQVVVLSYIGAGVLELFDARTVQGRVFGADEYGEGAPPVAVVSRGFWRRHFGAETRLGGQQVTVDSTSFTIVGVIDDSFRMPIIGSAFVAGRGAPEVWTPFRNNALLNSYNRPIMNVVGRLREGTSIDVAAAEIEAVNASLIEDFADVGYVGNEAPTIAMALDERVAAGSRTIVLLLFGAAGCLLLIGCANVANLLLARASVRSNEISIRASLGATRTRLVEQLLTENAVLALIACTAGVALASVLMRAIASLSFVSLPPSAIVQVDLRVAGFAILCSAATTLLFGLGPALHVTRRAASLVPGTGVRVTDGNAQTLRSSLVAAEVALAVVLLVGAGLLSRSFIRLSSVDPGFRADGVLAVPISLGVERWPTANDREQFHTQLRERVGLVPGIESFGAVNRVPLGGSNVIVQAEFERGHRAGRENVGFDRRVITPGYFETLEIPLLEGRYFDDADLGGDAEPVAIVNAAARDLFLDGAALDQRIRLQLSNGPGHWLRVVGVVGDIKHHGLAATAEPEIYVPYAQASVQSMVLLARFSAAPEPAVEAVRAAIWDLDDQIALDGVAPLATIVSNSVSDPRVRMLVVQAFAVLALGLAGLGIAGVVSFSVSRRSRDYGIRMALGARAGTVVALALREGLVPGTAGAVVGIVGAVAGARVLGSLLYATSPTDPLTFAVVAALLFGIIMVSSWIPARRATLADPAVVLREE